MHSTPKRQMKEEDKTGEQGEKFCLFAVALACLAMETRGNTLLPEISSICFFISFSSFHLDKGWKAIREENEEGRRKKKEGVEREHQLFSFK